MMDKNKFLPAGTQLIEANGTRYKIQRGIATGGSAVVYEAEQEGSFRVFVLKECYPNSKEFSFTRRKGVVCPTDSTNLDAENYLRLIKKNIEREDKIGQLIANKTGRTVASWGKLNVKEIILDGQSYNAADSLFIVMERINDDEKLRGIFLVDLLDECAKSPVADSPLRNGGTPSPYVATRILEELLKSLSDIHLKAGYIHGDINDANFFLMGHDFRRGYIGVGQLLDFGNARKILHDGMTEPLENVFSTPGYWSPEIFQKGIDPLRLTVATDIYSAGCLMLYLFYGMKYKAARGKNLAKSGRIPSISIAEAVRRGYRQDAAKLFIKILSKALQFKPEDRYSNGSEMLDDIIQLKKLTAPPKFLLAQNLSRSPYFVDGSRDMELAELQKALDAGTHPLWIWGVGGIGKTELAMEFARKQIERGRSAYLVTFINSLEETILNMRFSGWHFNGNNTREDRVREYVARLDLLKDNYKNTLLIIDNFDSDTKTIDELCNEPAYRDLLGLDIKILFTTRSRPDETTHELQSLSAEDCMKLFSKIAKEFVDEDEATIRDIVREVDFHTMTVDMLARTLKKSWRTLSAPQLLEHLKRGRIDSAELPIIMHTKGMTEREAHIYGHLRTLFRLVNSDEYRDVLCDLVLIPPDGFDATDFLKALDGAGKKKLKKLENEGWCRRSSDDNLLFVHSLIRTLVKNELHPTNATCRDFLDELWRTTRYLDDEYPLDEVRLKRLSKLYINAGENVLGDPTGTHKYRAGHCQLLLKSFVVAYVYLNLSLEIQQTIFHPLDPRVATLSLETGLANLLQRYFADLKSAHACIFKALEIFEQIGANAAQFAETYTAMALLFERADNCDEAIRWGEKALTIFETEPPKNESKTSVVHRIIGRCLVRLGKFDDALRSLKTAATILKRLTPQGHLDLVDTYREIAELYKEASDFDRAIQSTEETIRMLEGMQPENFGELGKCHGFLHKIYGELFTRTQKGEFFRKSSEEFEISQRFYHAHMLPVNLSILEQAKRAGENDVVVKRYSQAVNSCIILNRYEDAKKYVNAASKAIVPNTDPIEICHAYLVASELYTKMKEFDRALDYAHRALATYEKAFQNDEEDFWGTLNLNINNIHNIISLENS